jgi:hypothetical protein
VPWSCPSTTATCCAPTRPSVAALRNGAPRPRDDRALGGRSSRHHQGGPPSARSRRSGRRGRGSPSCPRASRRRRRARRRVA